MKALAAFGLGVILLGYLSPVAAGMLLCIGDGSDPDCCGDRYDSRESRLDRSTQFLNGSDCGCCVTVDAVPSTAGASFPKASVDVLSGSALLRKVTLPTGPRIPGSPGGGAGEAGLSALRTVVLLI